MGVAWRGVEWSGVAAVMDLSDEALEKRLLTRDFVAIGSNVTSCATRLKVLLDALASGGGGKQGLAKLAEHVIRELRILQAGIDRVRVVEMVSQKEMDECRAVKEEIEGRIEAAKATIVSLQVELAKEQLIRRRKEQYEELARAVNRLPPRRVVAQEIEALREKLEGIEKEKNHVDEVVDARNKQMRLFMQQLYNLQNSHTENEPVVMDEEEEIDDDGDKMAKQADEVGDIEGGRANGASNGDMDVSAL